MSRVIKMSTPQGKPKSLPGLFAKWKRCGLTGCAIRPILRASHIKPWRHSTNEERLDVFNGLLLSPNMDALFDLGLITFFDNGHVLRGPEISAEDLFALGCKPDLTVKFTKRHAPFLEYHRDKVFGPRMKAAKTKRARVPGSNQGR
jgi:hypothetical protein